MKNLFSTSKLFIFMNVSSIFCKFHFFVNDFEMQFICKIFSFRKLIYLHQLTRIKIACFWYSNESLFYQKQNSWSIMYLTIFYRDFQRLSHIANTWFISSFQNFRIEIYAIFLITSFDEYIEICFLEFEHQCRTIDFSFLIWIIANRLFDFDLHRYIIFFQRNRNFMKFTCLTFTNRRRIFSNIIRWWRRRFVTFSKKLLSKTISRMMMKKKNEKKNLKMFYIIEIIFELKLIWSLRRWRRRLFTYLFEQKIFRSLSIFHWDSKNSKEDNKIKECIKRKWRNASRFWYENKKKIFCFLFTSR